MSTTTVLRMVQDRWPKESLPPTLPLPHVAQGLYYAYRPVEFMERCRERIGPVFTVRFPRYHPEVMFTHPDAIKEIFTGPAHDLHAGEVNAILEPLVGANSLLLLERERHLRERRLLLPPFHGERMHTYGTVMRRTSNAAIDRMPVGERFSLHPFMQELTLDIILETVFGVTAGEQFERIRAALTELLECATNPLLLFPLFQVNLGRLTPYARTVELKEEIDQILFAEFAKLRREGTEGRTDILSMLIDARDEDGLPMSDQELRDEMMTLLVAGHETTATALAWSMFRILRDPRVLRTVRDELEEGSDGTSVDVDRALKLPYLDATIKETLRLNPVIPNVGRVLKKPMTIGGVDLPEGCSAVPALYLTHREPSLYPDPLSFQPERFLDKKPNPYAFFPFGGGRRRCIGMAFAMYEMKIALAQLILRCDLELEPGYRGRIRRRSITLTPEDGVLLTMKHRRPTSASERS